MRDDPQNPSYINVKNPGHGLTALVNDGNTNNTVALQAIFNYVAGRGRVVYFPPGKYLIESDVTIKNDTRVYGSRRGISLIKTAASEARKTKFASTEGDIRVSYLFFDGVNVGFKGRNSKIFVSKCVFFLSSRPTSRNVKGSIVNFLKTVTPVRYSTNALGWSVFLRDKFAFGKGAEFNNASGIKIRHNIFGLDLGNLDWIDTELRANYWRNIKLKISYLKTQFNLSNDQGYFKTAINTGFTNDTLITNNIFNGSPNFRSCQNYQQGPPDPKRCHLDHVVYLKGFYRMKFLKNYARGWSMDPSGGIKVRNGQNVVIARNYIDGTGILLYTHIKANAGVQRHLYKGLKDALIYGNYIVERRSNFSACNRTTGISYYEPHRKMEEGNDKNLRYSENIFKIVRANNSTPQGACIWLTNGNVSEHHVYRDNVFDVATKTVGIQSRWVLNPSYENGDIPLRYIRRYINLTVPNYNIPPYG